MEAASLHVIETAQELVCSGAQELGAPGRTGRAGSVTESRRRHSSRSLRLCAIEARGERVRAQARGTLVRRHGKPWVLRLEGEEPWGICLIHSWISRLMRVSGGAQGHKLTRPPPPPIPPLPPPSLLRRGPTSPAVNVRP
jgi:hypothetical protein